MHGGVEGMGLAGVDTVRPMRSTTCAHSRNAEKMVSQDLDYKLEALEAALVAAKSSETELVRLDRQGGDRPTACIHVTHHRHAFPLFDAALLRRNTSRQHAKGLATLHPSSARRRMRLRSWQLHWN